MHNNDIQFAAALADKLCYRYLDQWTSRKKVIKDVIIVSNFPLTFNSIAFDQAGRSKSGTLVVLTGHHFIGSYSCWDFALSFSVSSHGFQLSVIVCQYIIGM